MRRVLEYYMQFIVLLRHPCCTALCLLVGRHMDYLVWGEGLTTRQG